MADTPKIRFKGFVDAWEQRKLGEIAGNVIGGGTPKTSVAEYWDGSIPWIQSSNVQENEMFEFEIPKSITQIGLDKSAAKLIPKNSIAVVTHVGVGKLVFVPFSYATSQDFTSLAELKTDAKFTCYSLYQRIQNDLHIVQGSAIKGITKEDLLTKEIMVPEIEEQKKIGKYFSTLDHLITLHQHKCDETKELKRYMLQKMFPRNGKKNPEIRFAGFTDDWEQRKLSEIADKVTEKNKNNEFNEPFTNSAELGIVSQRDYFDREVVNQENLDGYYIVKNDDFVYNPRISVTAPVGPINRNRLGRNGVMSPLYTVFRTHGIDNLYLEFYFKTTSWHRFMKLNGDSGARFDRFTISSTQFMEMPIPLPDKEEQRKIGQYFDVLDHLITLHQRKCDELKEVRKFMLQNMFPQKG